MKSGQKFLKLWSSGGFAQPGFVGISLAFLRCRSLSEHPDIAVDAQGGLFVGLFGQRSIFLSQHTPPEPNDFIPDTEICGNRKLHTGIESTQHLTSYTNGNEHARGNRVSTKREPQVILGPVVVTRFAKARK